MSCRARCCASARAVTAFGHLESLIAEAAGATRSDVLRERGAQKTVSAGADKGAMLTLTASGYLQPGIHDASLDELEQSFGRFQESDRRIRLFEKLRALVEQVRPLGFVKHLIVDGSFVTAKPEPGDIDLIVAVEREVLERGEWSPAEYNALSSRRLKRQYPFDVFVAPVGGPTYRELVAYFSRVRGDPQAEKGVVRVAI